MSNLIKPHGAGKLLPLFVENKNERQGLIEESKALKKIVLNSSSAANAVMKSKDKYSEEVVKMANYAKNFGCSRK